MIARLEAWAASAPGLVLLAGLAVLLVGALAAWLDRRWRALRYARAKQLQPVFDPVAESRTPAALLAQALEPAWFQACQNDLKAEDNKAMLRQRLYHSCVARCVGVLSFGVVIMCISVIIYRDAVWLKKFATHFDLIAAFYALGWFIVARHVNRTFVITRSFVETLRAWMHLAIIFPLERSDDVLAAYRAWKKETAERFWGRKGGESQDAAGDANARPRTREVATYRRVERRWTEMHRECRAAGPRSPSSSADLGFYVKERPLEQLKFFITAQARLYAGQHSREWLMTGLYVASVTLAILKALSVFKDDLPPALIAPIEFATVMPVDWTSTALLVVMVLSAAATNAYISRNERSLMHSYHAQERRIRKWFESFAVTSVNGTGQHTPDAALAFEEIMLNDLLDFIHITSRDVIEVPGR